MPPPPPRTKRSAHFKFSTPPRSCSSSSSSSSSFEQETSTLRASPPPPPRLRRMAHVSGVHHVMTANIPSRECNQIHAAEDTADSCAPLLTPCRSKLNENQGKTNMVNVEVDTAKEELEKEGNVYVKLENFGKNVDDELQDLERFGSFTTPIHNRQKKTSLSDEQQQPVQSQSSSPPSENSNQPPSHFATVRSNSSRSGSSGSGHHRQKKSSSSDEQHQPARSVVQSQSSSSPSARSAQSSVVQSQLSSSPSENSDQSPSHFMSVRSNSSRSGNSGSGHHRQNKSSLSDEKQQPARSVVQSQSSSSPSPRSAQSSSHSTSVRSNSCSSSCSSNSTSSSQSNHVISSPMTASCSTCTRSTSEIYNRLSQCGVQQIVSSPMTGPSSPLVVGNALIINDILEPINSNVQDNSNINGGNDTSQHTINKKADDQSCFSPAAVQAEISRRLAAKEQYHMHKMRVVNLMKNNSGRHQNWHQRQQHGGNGTELLKSKPNDGLSSKWGTVFDDCDKPSSARHLRPSQLKQLHEHQESYHEMLIHPASVDGTAAAAAWHLHGQTGGREKRADLISYNKSDHNEIYLAMNTRDIMNVMREFKHDTTDSRGDASPRRQVKRFNSDSDDVTNVKMEVMKNGITILSSSSSAAAGAATSGEGVKATYSETADNLHREYDGPTKDNQHQRDVWSTGIAAAIVTGTAARYYKTFFMFPHGRQVLLPVITGALATALSLVTLLSCQFMTILSKTHVNEDEEGVSEGESGGFSGTNQVLQVGPWRYLSINTSYSDGEVCLSYPSNLAMDMPFLVARSTSALASFFGCVMVLWTLTLICAPASRGNMNASGLCFTLVGVLEGLTALLYQTQNCKSQSFDTTDGTDGVGGHLGGGECRPNQDLVFCIASSILHLATGWMLHVSYKFLSNAGVGNASSSLPVSGFASMEVYTWSSEARSSNPRRGILRTVEKCWTKIPDGSTLMATVFVEQRVDVSGGNCGTGSGGGKLKTKYSIQTEILPA